MTKPYRANHLIYPEEIQHIENSHVRPESWPSIFGTLTEMVYRKLTRNEIMGVLRIFYWSHAAYLEDGDAIISPYLVELYDPPSVFDSEAWEKLIRAKERWAEKQNEEKEFWHSPNFFYNLFNPKGMKVFEPPDPNPDRDLKGWIGRKPYEPS